MKRIVVIYSVLSLLSVTAFAQVNSGLMTTLSAVAGMRDRFPIEKLYLQLDKPYYTLGDTLRFKAYLLNADFLKPSNRSGLLYVELDNSNGTSVKRILVPLTSGISWGDMALDEKMFPEGSYTLRAYTNWMLNFGDDYVFKKSIYISALSGSTLVKAGFKLESGADKDKISANILFTGLDKKPLRLKDMQLKIMNGRHNLFKDKVTTGMDGSLDVNFDLADKTAIKNLSIQVQETGKGADTAKLTIPVILNRAENTDVQFMPEGGHLVAGITTKVGFKAIGEDGKATEINGKIVNSKQQEIVVFKSTHKGMGNFELTPQAGESYTAKVTLPGNITKTYPLPIVNPAGTTMRINPKGKDSLEVILTATAGLLSANSNFYLIGLTRGLICYTSLINFKGITARKVVAKDMFPSGIAHFTLLNNANQPLNERIVYIDHNDYLQISVTAHKPNYGTRDSIALAITVKDKDGKPMRGSFSMAVTDNSQIKADSTNSSIISNLLLTSDLKGNVEEPGYYFENDNNTNNISNRAIYLDNLLLTQGWIGYDWKAIFDPIVQQPKFPAEPEFIVQGKVTDVLNKPVEGSEVLLFSRKPQMVKTVFSDKDGQFIYKGLFPVDTAEFKIQARNKRGKSFNVGIEMMNEFKPPRFEPAGQTMPWYVNSGAELLNNSTTKTAQLKAEADYKGEGNQLKEVIIKEKKIVKGSHNLNGPGEADQIFDEQDMLKAGKTTLRKLIEQKVTGFTLAKAPLAGGPHPPQPVKPNDPFRMSYKLFEKEVHLVFDGMDVDEFYEPSIRSEDWYRPPGNWLKIIHERQQLLDTYLDYFSAEDIVGIEVMYNVSYNQTYGAMLNGGFGQDVQAYIEITTRSGKGPFMKLTPGTYLYKPLPFTLPKDFYRPRYTVKNSKIAPGTDLRSTIHWAPQVITDKGGKATVSFFSADKPVDYTLVMEGIDMNGDLGYKRQQINGVSKTGGDKMK